MTIKGGNMEKTFWHPVALIDSVLGEAVSVQLLGVEVVLWRDNTGQVHAWLDQCPHRGAKLSLGRVCDNRLQCPYHGWTFQTDGKCVNIPSAPSFSPPISHAVKVFIAQEAYGLVWVCLDMEKSFLTKPPVFAAEEHVDLLKVMCGPYDVATSGPRVVENFLDMAHFSFVHDGWLGNASHAQIDDYEVITTDTGLIANHCKVLQPKSHASASTSSWVEYTYEVTSPYTAVLTKESHEGITNAGIHKESIALFICPITSELSRVWFRLAVSDLNADTTELVSFQTNIFKQDQPILESQNPKCLPLKIDFNVHTLADKASTAYRRYLKKIGVSFGVIQ